MRLLIQVIVLSLCAPIAWASSFSSGVSSAGSSAGSSLSQGAESGSDTSSSAFDDKRIINAQAEAASFVASNGALRSAQLQEAFDWLRSQGQQHSDQHLAEQILAR